MAHINEGLDDISVAFHVDSSGKHHANLEGNIVMTTDKSQESSTLDEPIKVTILRDLKAVGRKLMHVIYPRRGQELLRDWDLWGPFCIFIILALVLQLSHGSKEDAGAPEFAQVFTIFWLGVITVSVNSKLLGGTLSFFQSVCVLGYCIFPLVMGLVINCIIKLVAPDALWVIFFRVCLVIIGLVYSIFASATFITPTISRGRVGLAVYPLCLFYFFIGWLVFVNTGSGHL